MAMTATALGRHSLRAVLALAIVVPVQLAAVAPASSQEAQPRPRNLMEFLFGQGNRRAEPAPRPPVARERPRKRPQEATTVRSPEPEVAVVDKLPTARTVLVIGDFIGSGLAEALTTVFAENPSIRVVDRTNGSSGFVRDDFYNWPAEIVPLLEAETPAAVVVMMGANDRQEMRVGDVREPRRSENWTKAYEARVATLAKAVREKSIPLLWVGLPAFKSTSVSSDILAFNDIYRNAAESVGGIFVDIWDGFVDENGAFVTTGPDMNGQPVRLRSGDNGINLTKAGKRKVAFYAEKPLEKILGTGPVPLIGGLGLAGLPDMTLDPRLQPAIDRTSPISLTDPELDGGDELLGAIVEPRTADGRTAAEKLAIEGIAPPASPGRADDFLVRPASAEVQSPAPAAGESTSAIGN